MALTNRKRRLILSGALRGGGGVPINRNGYYFAAGALRENQTESNALDDTNRFSVHRVEFFSPAYPTNNFRVPLPGYWTTTVPTYVPASDTNPSERDASNAYTVEGAYMHAFVGGVWLSKPIPNSAVTVQPGVGVLLPDCIFDGPVPANTRMMFSGALNVPNGGKMMAGKAPSAAVGRLEGARMGASSQLGQAAGTAALTGTDGRIFGGIFCPPWIVAKAVGGIDRHVVLVHGDSKFYGKNYFEAYNAMPYLSLGPIAECLDTDTGGSIRIPYANISIPSIGVEQRNRANWSRKLDLIRLVPNRPYTAIVTNSYNNGWLADINGDGYRVHFGKYYDILRAESRAWENAAAPLYQDRPIARAGGSKWATTLVDQSPEALTDQKWAGFDIDLVNGYFNQLAGKIDSNRDFAADTGSSRNKVKVSPKTYTLAADAASGATSISLVELPTVGDNLIMNPNSAAGASYIRSFSGSGPYTALTYQGVAIALLAGAVIQTSYVHDNVGLHPSNIGGKAMQTAQLEWKVAALSGVPS